MILATIFGLSACSQDVDIVQKYNLAPDEEVVFEIEIDRPMHVGFEFELGSDSWKAASNCPKIKDSEESLKIKLCGGIYNLENENNKILSQNGGGMNFTPKNGKLRMKLVNFARRSMDFEVQIEEAKHF